MPDVPYTWRAQAIAGARQLVVAVITSAVILTFLILGFRGQSNNEQQVREDQLNATLATVCVLALPVDEAGRNPADIRACFTQYNLPAPQVVR